MTLLEFNTQLSRLKVHFGEKHFSQEMATLLFKDWQQEPENFFKRAVEHFILELRSPPKGSDFSVFLREIKLQRGVNSVLSNAQTFFSQEKGIPEEVRYKTSMIQRRIQGRCPDPEWNEFMRTLADAARLEDERVKCDKCYEGGLVLATKENYGYAFACNCPHGKNYKQYPIWQNKLMEEYQLCK